MRALFTLGAAALLLVPDRDPTPADELAKMQGEWQVVRMREAGAFLPEAEAAALHVRIDKGRASLYAGDNKLGSYALVLDPSRKPRAGDLKALDGSDKDLVLPAIYALEGDVLKVALDPEGRRRPTAFEGKEAANTTMVVLRRRK